MEKGGEFQELDDYLDSTPDAKYMKGEEFPKNLNEPPAAKYPEKQLIDEIESLSETSAGKELASKPMPTTYESAEIKKELYPHEPVDLFRKSGELIIQNNGASDFEIDEKTKEQFDIKAVTLTRAFDMPMLTVELTRRAHDKHYDHAVYSVFFEPERVRIDEFALDDNGQEIHELGASDEVGENLRIRIAYILNHMKPKQVQE